MEFETAVFEDVVMATGTGLALLSEENCTAVGSIGEMAK